MVSGAGGARGLGYSSRMNDIIRALALLIPLGFAAGCGGWKMMPAPVAYSTSGVDPFASMTPEEQSTTVEILYATDRSRTKYRRPEKWYGEKRGLALRLGSASVRLGGKNATWSEVARESRADDRPPMTIESLEEYGKLWTTIPLSDGEDFPAAAASESPDDPIRAPERRFVAEINRRLARSSWKEVVIYVPGLNTPFTSPVYMMAQYKHFMGHDGVFIAYSWPAKSSFFGYSEQVVNASVSTRNLRELILLVAQETNAEQINLISYSAGAPVATQALLQIRLLHADDTAREIRDMRLGSVIYAGADEDLDYFRNLYLDRFNEVAENITVYTSSDDAGLGLSRLFMSGSARLGSPGADLTPADREALRDGSTTSLVDVRQATHAAGGGDLFTHSYWYMNPWVNQDVINLLRTNAPASDRGLVREKDGALWGFPKNYPEIAPTLSGVVVP